MNILVIGLGSMGRRRIRLLKQISASFDIIGVDSKAARRKQAEDELSVATMDDLSEALKKHSPECAVISTSPLSHADIIETCLNAGCHVFTELNLVKNKYESNMALAKKQNKTLFLSSTFLYRKEIEYIDECVKKYSGNLNYIYHIGQYLPDWHPWENINEYFVGDKKTNGCREILAIELPWLIKTFGEISSVRSLSGKNTALNIQYKDNYLLLLEHSSGHKGMLAVDVVCRRAVRNLEIFGEDLYISWDGTPEGLINFDIESRKEIKVELYSDIIKMKEYAAFIIENDYRNELEAFLNVVRGKANAKYSFEDDLKTLTLIDKIEEEEFQ